MMGALLVLATIVFLLFVYLAVVATLALGALWRLNRLIDSDSGEAYLQAIRSQRTPVPFRRDKQQAPEQRGRPVAQPQFKNLEEMDPEEAYKAITSFAGAKE